MVQLKRATIGDTDAILEAKTDAWVDEIKLYGHGPENYNNKEAFQRLFETHRIYKIVNDDEIIGGITCVNSGGNVYYIGSVFVKRCFQNQHIGTMAMEFLFCEIQESVLWKLNTPHLSHGNQHFYEKLGFAKVGESKPDDTGFHLFYYEKEGKVEEK